MLQKLANVYTLWSYSPVACLIIRSKHGGRSGKSHGSRGARAVRELCVMS